MRVGIKYCGGCNPLYRRERVEEVLREAFPEIYFFYISSGDQKDFSGTDLVVCISGCKRGCAVESVESAVSKNSRISVAIMSIDCGRKKEDIIAEFNRCLKG